EGQLSIFLDPNDPEVIEQARKDGIDEEWIKAAQKSPVYKMAIDYKIAFPLHPEYRTLPMVWYVPPLSPIMSYFEGKDSIKNPDMIFPAIEEMRIPIDYIASLLTAGKRDVIILALQRMAMMRQYMRAVSAGKDFDISRLERLGLTEKLTKEMYRLLAIAKYKDRFVIPTSHKEGNLDVYTSQGSSGYDDSSNCGGCSLSGDSFGSNNSPEVNTENQDSYGEEFYGGIWRD